MNKLNNMTGTHGLASTYGAYGCRCDACTKAQADKQSNDNRNRYKRTADHGPPPDVQHGETAYNNWGCRCDICKVAKSEANKRQRAARMVYAAEHGIPDRVRHPGAYTSWGCRCEVCVSYRNAYLRERYEGYEKKRRRLVREATRN